MKIAPRIAIVIPARYGSTRFPGKPLAKINGRTMLSMVVDVARTAAQSDKNISVFVTTEDQRIADHCAEIGVECILTGAHCATGSDRVLEAVRKSGKKFDIVVNLQGDAPFTAPQTITKIIEAFQKKKDAEVVTPVRQLYWNELDALREAKKTTPFSGTTVIVDPDTTKALWFSKAIIPVIRDEKHMRELCADSPVCQHIGLYGFRMKMLEKFCALKRTKFEATEGLEQLRLLENGIPIHTVKVDEPVHSGIDSPEDLQRAQAGR